VYTHITCIHRVYTRSVYTEYRVDTCLPLSFAKEPYKRDNILQKRPIILRSGRHVYIAYRVEYTQSVYTYLCTLYPLCTLRRVYEVEYTQSVYTYAMYTPSVYTESSDVIWGGFDW